MFGRVLRERKHDWRESEALTEFRVDRFAAAENGIYEFRVNLDERRFSSSMQMR